MVISDNKDMDILPILPITNAYIECASRQGNVLIHWCAHVASLTSSEKGISRSPAVIAAYLIKKDNMSFEDAYRLLRSKRRCVQINEGRFAGSYPTHRVHPSIVLLREGERRFVQSGVHFQQGTLLRR